MAVLFGGNGCHHALLDIALRDQPLDSTSMARRFETVRGPQWLKNIRFNLDNASSPQHPNRAWKSGVDVGRFGFRIAVT